MYPPPNELYSAFSFIGFVFCAIPFYWHFKARNTGTCLYMFWTGLGCLLQCINSIVWNKNMINRAPIYCDISTHIQIAQNVAIPACSLCINRQLYRVSRMKRARTTDAENRRILLIDLLIGIGIPVLQMIVQYVVSYQRYIIYEDFGPAAPMANTLLRCFLISTWPLAIGIVSFFYCAVSVYTFYKHEIQSRQMMLSTYGFSRSRYLRLMTISLADIFGTIPLATFIIVSDVKAGIEPWKGWAYTHSHYSVIVQVAGFEWKNIPELARGLEMFRWSLVACAFLFFALYGFAAEAREHYYCLYKFLARCIGYSMSTPHGVPHIIAPSVPFVKRKELGRVTVTVPIMVTTHRHKDSMSLTDGSSIPSESISTTSILNPDSATEQASVSDTMSFYHSAKSFAELEVQGQSSPPAGSLLTAPSSSVPPHFSDNSESTMPVHASPSVEAV